MGANFSGRSFVFFRNPRPDAFDPATGERYDDVIVLWVESDEAKQAREELRKGLSDTGTPDVSAR